MSIPSSPPLPTQGLSGDDIPDSPTLGPAHNTRKRHWSDHDSLSSDPVFSEDASESDEQTGTKRKRLFKGPWWMNTAFAPRRGDKPMKFSDSGVWLASESSDVSMGRLDDIESVHRGSSPPPMHEPSWSQQSVLPSAEALASRIVLDCVDTGKETVDLSDMSLNCLSSDTLRPLHQLIRSRDMDRHAGNAFVSLTPDLKIYLYRNNLKTLPSELWLLENITVLSLRNNELRELPEWIGKLRKLEELNIAGNQIESLPFELLNLIHGRPGKALRLNTHPNPLYQPVDTQYLVQCPPIRLTSLIQAQKGATASTQEDWNPCPTTEQVFDTLVLRIAKSRLRRTQVQHAQSSEPTYAACSEVAYYDADGAPWRLPGQTHTTVARSFDARAILAPPSAPPGRSTNAHSLFELAVRACRDSPFLKHLPSYLPMDRSVRVEAGLRNAMQSKEQDTSKCSVCTRPYVITRAEWIEYWHCNTSGTATPAHLAFLPFKRKACSWGCVVHAIAQRQEELDMSTRHDETIMRY